MVFFEVEVKNLFLTYSRNWTLIMYINLNNFFGRLLCWVSHFILVKLCTFSLAFNFQLKRLDETLCLFRNTCSWFWYFTTNLGTRKYYSKKIWVLLNTVRDTEFANSVPGIWTPFLHNMWLFVDQAWAHLKRCFLSTCSQYKSSEFINQIS